MCNSAAEGGVRCDVHLKATGVLFDYANKTVNGRLVDEDGIKNIWSSLRKGYKDAPAPSRQEYQEFLDKEKFRVEVTTNLSDAEKVSLCRKLTDAETQNLPSGAGFAAQKDFLHVVREQADKKRKALAAQRDKDRNRQAQEQAVKAEEAKAFTRQQMVEAYTDDEEYASWPIPQANDLDKVATVIDSISNDATTADSIGEAIDVGSRQGSYYANAAGYLGLVEKHKDDIGSTHYALTQAGQAFANSEAGERAAMLSEMVNRTPLGRSYRNNPAPEELEKEIASGGEAGGYSETVAKRRLSTLNTWIATVDNRESLTANITAQQKNTIARSVSASIKQQAEQAEKRRAFVAERTVGATCPTCFMIKPISGVCLNCD